MPQTKESPADQLIRTTHADYARRERLLNKFTPTLVILASVVGLGLGFVAAPAMAAFLGGAVVQGTVAACAIGGGFSALAAYGFIDKYSCRWGARALFLSGMQAERNVQRFEHEYKMSLPLKGHAVKAFIKSFRNGITEPLRALKPFRVKTAPRPEF